MQVLNVYTKLDLDVMAMRHALDNGHHAEDVTWRLALAIEAGPESYLLVRWTGSDGKPREGVCKFNPKETQ